MYHFFPDIIGLLGTSLCLIAYFLVNMGKVVATQLTFPLLNACGASCLIVSLTFHFNLAAMVIEVAWLIISVLSIGLYFLKKRRIALKCN